MILFNLYQINTNKDLDGMCFMSLDSAYKKHGEYDASSGKLVNINTSIYEKTYGGEVEKVKSLEDIYVMFNVDKPRGYEGRSMSVSDVIEVINSDEIKPGYYYCDVVGFEEVNFA